MMRYPEHEHRAHGTRVKAASVAADKTHFHLASDGATSLAPNRPGHRHLLRSGQPTAPASESWSVSATARL
jgi:hypothetical protein